MRDDQVVHAHVGIEQVRDGVRRRRGSESRDRRGARRARRREEGVTLRRTWRE